MDTNIFVNLIASTACGAMATAVTLVTAENTDAEVREIKKARLRDHQPDGFITAVASSSSSILEMCSSWAQAVANCLYTAVMTTSQQRGMCR
jgi:hypothetical protein